MVHFIMDAVKALDLSLASTNQRGTGHAQYPPSMMLGLLIDCYATGTFSSRRIQTLTYENVAVRFLTADTNTIHTTQTEPKAPPLGSKPPASPKRQNLN